MKSVLYMIISFCFCSTLSAQLDPVHWTTNVVPVEGENSYELQAEAAIDRGWHLYSQQKYPAAELAPTPTEFLYELNAASGKLIGATNEPKGITKMDPIFEMNIKYFEDKAVFKQKIQLKDASLTKVVGSVFYVVCDDKRCLAPEEKELIFELKKKAKSKTSWLQFLKDLF